MSNGVKVDVYKESGERTAEQIDLNPQIFGIQKIRPALVHEVVTALMSNARQPIASTKTRGQVRGGGKKPWQQKGTGRARAGSSRSPLWRGGGVTFGPTSRRNFFKKINQKAKLQSMFTVLSDRAASQKVLVLESFDLSEGKTRNLVEKLKQFAVLRDSRKVLIVVAKRDEKLKQAARNLKTVNICLASNLNVLELVAAEVIVVLRDALPIIEKVYLKSVLK